MKKLIYFVVLLLTISLLAFSGCKERPPEMPAPEADVEKTEEAEEYPEKTIEEEVLEEETEDLGDVKAPVEEDEK